MEYILDDIFSSWLLALIPIIIFFAIIVRLLMTNFFENEKLNNAYRLVLILLLPVAFMTVFYLNESWGYGYADDFEAAASNKKWVCLVTEGSFKMHRKNSSTQLDQRLNVLDAKTGKRIYRHVIGYFLKIISLRGDTLFYQSGNSGYKLYDIKSGKKIASLTYETLPGMYNELSAGVDDCIYNENTKVIKVTGKTGMVYYLEPFSMKLLAEEPAIKKPDTDRELRFISDYFELDHKRVRKLQYKKDGPLSQITDEKETIIADNLINAAFLENVPSLSRYIVRSYETTDKMNFILSCFSYDNKLLWQVKQNTFNADDYFTRSNSTGRYGYTSTMNKYNVTNDSFIFTIQGFVFSIDLNSGKTNWSTRI